MTEKEAAEVIAKLVMAKPRAAIDYLRSLFKSPTCVHGRLSCEVCTVAEWQRYQREQRVRTDPPRWRARMDCAMSRAVEECAR